tara:strand:- start:948 stop:1406 length:459 start_codon:yes stop_codon:yes gene_type:complete
MHEKEIQFFTEAFKLAQENFYVDAIHKFQELVNDYPESDLADDAMYNIGLCYYQMNQFQKCVDVLEKMIEKYPDATITALENGNEFGKTAAKAYYLIVQCYIGLGDIQKAGSFIPILENYTDSYVMKDSEKSSFAMLSKEVIKTYIQIKETG